MIQRKGAKTALITTAGFRDVLEIAREHRYDLYDLFLELPNSLVPALRSRFEINERLFADGPVHKPLNELKSPTLIARLTAEGVEAVAVSLIHSPIRIPPTNARVVELLNELAPEMIVSAPSHVAPVVACTGTRSAASILRGLSHEPNGGLSRSMMCTVRHKLQLHEQMGGKRTGMDVVLGEERPGMQLIVVAAIIPSVTIPFLGSAGRCLQVALRWGGSSSA